MSKSEIAVGLLMFALSMTALALAAKAIAILVGQQ
jgi:hypothetical protein